MGKQAWSGGTVLSTKLGLSVHVCVCVVVVVVVSVRNGERRR